MWNFNEHLEPEMKAVAYFDFRGYEMCWTISVYI